MTSPAEAEATERQRESGDRVVYAYGVVHGRDVVDCPGEGLDGAPVVVLEHDGIGIVASELPSHRFGTQVWERHAEDPLWLEEVARAHHGVLRHVAATGDVVPLRMPAVYTSEAGAQEMMSTQRRLLDEALERVRGRLEWGVKMYVDTAASTGSDPEPRPTSGRDYLAQRSTQAQRREEGRQRRVATVTEVYEQLAGTAADAVSNPPQDAALSGRSEPMMLNAAYLVGRDESEAFQALARRLADGPCAEEGLLLEVTGPWPVYNFAVAPG